MNDADILEGVTRADVYFRVRVGLSREVRREPWRALRVENASSAEIWHCIRWRGESNKTSDRSREAGRARLGSVEGVVKGGGGIGREGAARMTVDLNGEVADSIGGESKVRRSQECTTTSVERGGAHRRQGVRRDWVGGTSGRDGIRRRGLVVSVGVYWVKSDCDEPGYEASWSSKKIGDAASARSVADVEPGVSTYLAVATSRGQVPIQTLVQLEEVKTTVDRRGATRFAVMHSHSGGLARPSNSVTRLYYTLHSRSGTFPANRADIAQNHLGNDIRTACDFARVVSIRSDSKALQR
ncbi:hypothetical protein R3P38DRAFT_2807932 [Favolaschia claudopus]|uniref:Uncharacterized protein n=1 Tax=Favolaschia claudopus TaxID=2862362 RepID=A0AAV9ZHA1_9AGAR